jgi:hypothetical protein
MKKLDHLSLGCHRLTLRCTHACSLWDPSTKMIGQYLIIDKLVLVEFKGGVGQPQADKKHQMWLR